MPNKTITVNTTMGNYSISLVAPVDPALIDLYAAEYYRSIGYRKVSPKLDVPLANYFGKSRIDKKGNVVPNEGFKKKDLPWDADAAKKIATIYEKAMEGVLATVTKYVPSESAATQNKVKADLAVKLVLEQITIEEFRAAMKALEGAAEESPEEVAEKE